MKLIKIHAVIGFLLTAVSVFPQFVSNSESQRAAEYKSIGLSFDKTTSIIFPYAVKSVDRGSEDVLVQKVKGTENILLLKAGVRNFNQTNLTVVTADGKLYGFVLNYDEQCPIMNLIADLRQNNCDEILFSAENENQKKIKQYAELALSKKKKTNRLKACSNAVSLKVSGITIHKDILFLRIEIGNRSSIGYDVDQLRFFIRDQKRSVRTASQELEMIPFFATSSISRIADGCEAQAVFAFAKFTIPERKVLVLQLFEKDGGRNVELEIKNRDLINLDILSGL